MRKKKLKKALARALEAVEENYRSAEILERDLAKERRKSEGLERRIEAHIAGRDEYANYFESQIEEARKAIPITGISTHVQCLQCREAVPPGRGHSCKPPKTSECSYCGASFYGDVHCLPKIAGLTTSPHPA